MFIHIAIGTRRRQKNTFETDKIVNVKEKYNIFVVRCVIIETN